jgi:hypothetical protein
MGSPETAEKADDSCRAKASRECVLNQSVLNLSVLDLNQPSACPLRSAGAPAKLRGLTS